MNADINNYKSNTMSYKNSIYIGVGGSGIQTIQKVKEAFKKSNHGVVPPQIKFLCLDTDADSLASLKDIDLEEKISLAVEDPAGRYRVEMEEQRTEMFKYYPKTNVRHLSALDQGAGQIRANGHFAVIEHKKEIVKKLVDLRDEIASINIDPTEVIDASKLDVHMVFSTCGGTGSGSFLPIAYLIKRTLSCNLTGYLYTHKFFENIVEDTAVDSVRENSFAALLELDYCMNSVADVPFRFGNTIVDEVVLGETERPFDTVFLIDNKTLSVNRKVFNYATKEAAMAPVSTAMYIAAGDIATSHSSVMDNVKHKILEGSFDVANKHGWVMGLGVSKIVCDDNFRSNQTESVLKDQLIELIISGTQTDTTAIMLAKNWFNNELNINESGDEDDRDALINAIFDMSKESTDALAKYQENVTTSVTTLADDSTRSATINKDGIYSIKYSKLEEILYSALKNGVGLRKISGALHELNLNIDKAAKKLKNEIEEDKNEKTTIITTANKAAKQCEQTISNARIWEGDIKKRARDTYQDRLLELAQNYFVAYWNVRRKEAAVSIYSSLTEKVADLAGKVDEIMTKISEVRGVLPKLDAVNEQTNDATVPTLCHITNLSGMFSSIVGQSLSSISYSARDFYEKCFSSFIEAVNDSTVFVQSFNAYTSDRVSNMDNTLVKLCNDLRETKPEIFLRQLNEALRYSSPLICVDTHNMNSLVKYNEYFYIAGEENLVSVLKEAYRSVYPNKQITAINIGSMGNEAILYRIVGAVPPFFVKEISGPNDPLSLEHSFTEVKLRNLRRQRTPFSHSVLQAALENTPEFLTPENPADIERKEREIHFSEILKDWVDSFIFEDIVKEADGQFYMKVKRTCPGAKTKSAASPFALLHLGVDRNDAFNTFSGLHSELPVMLYQKRDYSSEQYLKYNGNAIAYIGIAMCDDDNDPLLIEETNNIYARQ